MNNEDRRSIINALEKEGRAEQNRILSTLSSFKNWMYVVLYVVYRKIANKIDALWNWLRLAFL